MLSSQPDLKDPPFKDLDVDITLMVAALGRRTLSSICCGTLHSITEGKPGPRGTSAQKSELVALIQVSQLAAGVHVTIHNHSKCASITLHAHGAFCREKGQINSGGKDIKYGKEILDLLDALWASMRVAAMHCQGHPKGDTVTAWGTC